MKKIEMIIRDLERFGEIEADEMNKSIIEAVIHFSDFNVYYDASINKLYKVSK